MMPRDSQRGAVYAWESALGLPTDARKSMGMDEVEAFVVKVWRAYVKDSGCYACHGEGTCSHCGEGRCGRCQGRGTIPSTPPTIKDGRGTSVARGSARSLNLPKWARTKLTICHELAHAILDRKGDTGPWHGRAFARLYLEMIVRYCGGKLGDVRRAGATQKPRRVHFAKVKDLDDILGRSRQAARPKRRAR